MPIHVLFLTIRAVPGEFCFLSVLGLLGGSLVRIVDEWEGSAGGGLMRLILHGAWNAGSKGGSVEFLVGSISSYWCFSSTNSAFIVGAAVLSGIEAPERVPGGPMVNPEANTRRSVQRLRGRLYDLSTLVSHLENRVLELERARWEVDILPSPWGSGGLSPVIVPEGDVVIEQEDEVVAPSFVSGEFSPITSSSASSSREVTPGVGCDLGFLSSPNWVDAIGEDGDIDFEAIDWSLIGL